MTATRPSLRRFSGLVATWFGAGLLPRAPGTWGSLAALPCAWLIVRAGGWPLLALGTALVFALGAWAADQEAKLTGIQDPGSIVVDEVAGQWLTLLAAPLDPLAYGIGFVLFRVADIAKPWPVSWADRKIKGGFGIMLDDVLAAAYAVLVMLAYRHFAPRVGL